MFSNEKAERRHLIMVIDDSSTIRAIMQVVLER